jgi:hypothetical protein
MKGSKKVGQTAAIAARVEGERVQQASARAKQRKLCVYGKLDEEIVRWGFTQGCLDASETYRKIIAAGANALGILTGARPMGPSLAA